MQTVFFSTFYCRYQQQAMSTSTIPKIVTTMSSNPSSPSSTTCKSVQQQDEQQHQQQQQQQQQQLQSSENNIVMKSFPWKLYLLLERCDYEKKYIYPTSTHAAAIQWNMSSSINSDSDISDVGCGKSFIIQNKEKFTKDILPHFFKCANTNKNKNNSNNDDINNNDGRNFDIFQANIDMWYVLLRIVAYCCVVLCCVFPYVLSLSISCALLFGTSFFTLLSLTLKSFRS